MPHKNDGRNFDDIATKFQKNIYHTPKGIIRKQILLRDLQEIPCLSLDEPIKILDLGGGEGTISIELAKMGHEIVLCDISETMLSLSKANAHKDGVSSKFTWLQTSIQDYPEDEKFDFILCHAVFEWLEDPQEALIKISRLLSPNGILSLMFYNKSAMRLGNILYGNFDYVRQGMKVKKQVKLNPSHPLDPETVFQWVNELPLVLLSKTGVRCFHDYLFERQLDESRLFELLDMELTYSRMEPYASIGKYMHCLIRKDK